MNVNNLPLYFNSNKKFIKKYLKKVICKTVGKGNIDSKMAWIQLIKLQLMSKRPFFTIYTRKRIVINEIHTDIFITLFDKLMPVNIKHFPELLPIMIHCLNLKKFAYETFCAFSRRGVFKHFCVQDQITEGYDPVVYLDLLNEVVKDLSQKKTEK